RGTSLRPYCAGASSIQAKGAVYLWRGQGQWTVGLDGCEAAIMDDAPRAGRTNTSLRPYCAGASSIQAKGAVYLWRGQGQWTVGLDGCTVGVVDDVPGCDMKVFGFGLGWRDYDVDSTSCSCEGFASIFAPRWHREAVREAVGTLVAPRWSVHTR
ncbi:hypothetical protein DFP72DRAFT_894534, partial [Ephemerocybe angulata]